MKAMWSHARSLPPGLVVRKGAERIKHWVASRVRARSSAVRGTYLSTQPLFHALDGGGVLPTDAESSVLRALAAESCAHRFDLLGSGWVEVARTQPLEVPTGCRAESNRIAGMVSPGYRPIDWHVDFKSGHRWRADTWHESIAYGHLPGVDVKVPWELSRLQHLPALALAARVAANQEEAAGWRTEATDQMLDWIASNPPQFGVNWRTAMDVGIRAANMALAADLLLEDGFRGAWERVLARSLEEHAHHMAEHLEWSPQARGNHYLANVAGLAWCASHLSESDQTNAWIGWCAQELRLEVDRQFHADGSNFEASVCYHRLSAEIVAWTAASLASVPAARWARIEHAPSADAPKRPALVRGREPDWRQFRKSLAAMAAFTRWMTKHDGQVAQFGDNDSGRFFRLPGYTHGLEEASLDHSESLDVLESLCGTEPVGSAGRLAAAVAGWSGEVAGPSAPGSWGETLTEDAPHDGLVLTLGSGCWDGLATAAFPNFGVFVWRSRRVWMAVRCGTVGQGGLGGHAHADALTVELQVDGKDWIADPGTAAYTSDPATRNRYRSVHAHYCPRVAGKEPTTLDRGVFRMPEYGARCLFFGPKGFVGVHAGYGGEVKRSLRLTDTGFEIADTWDKGTLEPLPAPDAEHPWAAVPFSHGYGKVRS